MWRVSNVHLLGATVGFIQVITSWTFTSCPIPSIVPLAPRISRMGSQYGPCIAYCQAYTALTVHCGTPLCHPANPEKHVPVNMVHVCYTAAGATCTSALRQLTWRHHHDIASEGECKNSTVVIHQQVDSGGANQIPDIVCMWGVQKRNQQNKSKRTLM